MSAHAPQTRPVLVRIHLASGLILEAKPEMVSCNPSIGAYMTAGDGRTAIPLAPIAILLREEPEPGKVIFRRFFGASLELVEEEAHLVIPAPRPFELVPTQ